MNKKHVVLALLVMVMLLLPVQASLGYGDTRTTAESKEPGVYDEYMVAGDSLAYYKLYLYNSAKAYVNIAFNFPSDF